MLPTKSPKVRHAPYRALMPAQMAAPRGQYQQRNLSPFFTVWNYRHWCLASTRSPLESTDFGEAVFGVDRKLSRYD